MMTIQPVHFYKWVAGRAMREGAIVRDGNTLYGPVPVGPSRVKIMLDFILNDAAFSHTRFRIFSCLPGGGYVTAYRRDPSSPSGVFAQCSLNAELFNTLVYPKVRQRAGGSPLSPTEQGGGM